MVCDWVCGAVTERLELTLVRSTGGSSVWGGGRYERESHPQNAKQSLCTDPIVPETASADLLVLIKYQLLTIILSV